MKMNYLTLLFAGLFLVTLAGCSGGGSEDEEVNTEKKEVSKPSGKTVLAARHEVEDYKKWLAVYDDIVDPNLRISNFKNIDNPTEIIVFEFTMGHEQGREAMASPETQKAMRDGGVVGEPDIVFADIKFIDPNPSSEKYRVMIQHEVTDYDAWREFFDADEPRRTTAGLSLRGMGTDWQNPNLVTIVFSTNDLEPVRAMQADEGMKEIMEKAGVSSEPLFTYLVVP